MVLSTRSIRDVIAFPKNRSAFCPLTHAPSLVSHEQLAELELLNLGGGEAMPGKAEKNLLETLSWVSRIGIREKEALMIETAVGQAEKLATQIQARATDEEPMFSVIPLQNRTRPGREAVAHFGVENGDLLTNAAEVKGDFFKVANIIE